VSIYLERISLTGSPTNHALAYILDFKPNEQNVFLKKGHLVILIAQKSLSPQSGDIWAGLPGVSLVKAKEILAKLQDDYFAANDNISSFDALRLSLDYSKEQFLNSSFEVAAVAQVGDTLYLAVFGEAMLRLMRANKLFTLIKGQPNKLICSSGHIKEGDILMASTYEFEAKTSQEAIKAILSQKDLEFISDSLVPIVRSSQDGSTAVLVGLFKSHETEINLPTTNLAIKSKLISLIDGVLNRLPSPRISVSSAAYSFNQPKPKKRAALVGVVFLAILIASIFLGVKRREASLTKEQYQSRLASISQELTEAITLKGINSSRARALLFNAYKELEEMKGDPMKDLQWQELQSKVESNLGSIAGIYRQEAPLYLDLTLVSSGFKADMVSTSIDRMAVADSVSSKLVEIEIDTKRTEVLAGPNDISEISDIALYSNRNFMLTESGVEEISGKAQNIIKKEWSGQALIQAFAGNIYVLEKQASKIYRFQAAGRGFGSKSDWLASDVVADLGSTKSWAIDGSIWILLENGKVLKFAFGKAEYFAFGDKPESNFVDLFVDENALGLYLLDSKEGSIWVYDKKGEFKAQYQIPQAKGAIQVVVSEENRKMLLLNDSKLYVVEIKHL